jgi:hypothetical protein
LRVENTVSDGQLYALVLQQPTSQTQLHRFFPEWRRNLPDESKNSLALTYSKRIERPNYQSLNPFEYQLDELSFFKGNPFLKPQYTDNIKLSHTLITNSTRALPTPTSTISSRRSLNTPAQAGAFEYQERGQPASPQYWDLVPV